MFGVYNVIRIEGSVERMILYRLAKWMEERMRLKKLIAESEGNPTVYIEQKALVEQQMIREAYQWLEPGRAAEEASELQVVDELGGVQPLLGIDSSDRLPALILRDVLANMQRDRAMSESLRPIPVFPEEDPALPAELYRLPIAGEEAQYVQP